MAENVEYVLTLKDLMSGKIKNITSETDKLNKSVGGIKGVLGDLATTAGITFGVAGIGMAVGSIVKAGTTVEDSLTGLTTLLKSKAEASNVINNTLEDATKTPFSFEGLLSANQALIGAGKSADRARNDVMNLANAVAGAGKGNAEFERMVGNLMQIGTTGKATAMDIKQFGTAGINIYQALASATGKPIDQVKEMEVSYDLLTYALQQASKEGGIYAGALANMSENTSVKISNVGDEIFKMSYHIYEDLKPAIQGALGVMMDFIGGLESGYNWLKQNKEIVIGVGIALGGAVLGMIAWNAYQGAMAVKTAITTGYIFLQMVQTDGLALAMYSAGITGATAWALIGGGITVVAGLFYILWQKSEMFRGAIYGIWGAIKGFVDFVKTYFQGVGDIIAGVFDLDPDRILKGVGEMTSAYKKVGEGAVKGYNEGVASFRKGKGKGADATTTEDNKATPPLTIAKPGDLGGGATTPKAKNATGQKSYSINISIDSLIKEQNINTTNIKEGAEKIREMVTSVLLSAVNDSQMIAER